MPYELGPISPFKILRLLPCAQTHDAASANGSSSEDIGSGACIDPGKRRMITYMVPYTPATFSVAHSSLRKGSSLSSTAESALRKTSLNALHRRLGAKMV